MQLKRDSDSMATDGIQQAVLTFNTAVYRLTAIKKAVYRFSDRCIIQIDLAGNTTAELSLECHDASVNLNALIGELTREITDQELREMISDETAGVRNLLLAQAFSATSLVEAPEEMADYKTDPLGVGFPDEKKVRTRSIAGSAIDLATTNDRSHASSPPGAEQQVP